MQKNSNKIEGLQLNQKKTSCSWDEWFAGVVDGDGYFYINAKKEISFELTTGTIDINILYSIKNKLKAGSIKLRSGSNSMRYRVKTDLTIKTIIHKLNGKLYNPVRLRQFEKACSILNIDLNPSPLKIQMPNAYLAGLIDAEGTITINVSKTSAITSQKLGKNGKIIKLSQSRAFNQLFLKITSVHKQPLLLIKNSYNFGHIYIEKKTVKNKKLKTQYHWTIRSYEDFCLLYENVKNYPLKSSKMHRLRLSFKYFTFKQLKYHLKDFNTMEYKIWFKFCQSWFKYTL